MQRDPLESGHGDHEPAGRPPLPRLPLDESRLHPGHPPCAHRQERNSDRHPLSAVDLCRSEFSHGQSPSPGWDPLLRSGPGTPGPRPVVATNIGAQNRPNPTRAMKQAIIDYYRCPEDLADFQLAGQVFEDPGYFCFGPETICYGRLSSRSPARQITGPLHDALTDIRPDGGVVRLPMNPNEIIDNLRYERYYRNGTEGRTRLTENPQIPNFYYKYLRPFLALPIRKHLQRMHLRDWRNIPLPHWPVDRTVEQILERLLALSMKA